MAGAAASIVIPIAGTTFAEVRAIPRAQRLRERLIDVTKQFAVTLDDAITPLANSVAAISSSTNQAERSRCQGQLIQAVVDAAARLCGDNRTRATFYEARPARGQIMTLVRRAYAGRGGTQPRLRFVRDEAGRDNAVIGLVEAREVHFIEDVKAEFPGQYDGKDYGTLIAVSVPGAERDCGMLAIDAPDPGDLEQIHVHTMQALAALLGSGLVAR
jgi:hypothetical protein